MPEKFKLKKVKDLDPKVRLMIQSKGSMTKKYDAKLFLKNGQIVKFSDFKESRDSFYFIFDDGTQLWEKQLCLPLFKQTETDISSAVYCCIYTKSRKTLRFADLSPKSIWEEVKNNQYKVCCAQSGFIRPNGSFIGKTDDEIRNEIISSLRNNSVEDLSGKIKSAIHYIFQEI